MMPTLRALPHFAFLPHVFLRHPPLPQAQGLCYGRLDLALPSQSFNHTAVRLLHSGIGDPQHPHAAVEHAALEHAALEHAALEHAVVEHAAIERAGLAHAASEDVAPALRIALQRLPIISSPAQRCLELARELHRLRISVPGDGTAGSGITTNGAATRTPTAHCRAPIVDMRLLEIDFGDWEGRAWSDLPRAQLDLWAADVAGYRMPGGESFADVIARVGEALADLREPHLIVSHGGVIRAAWHLLGGLPIADAAALQIAYAKPLLIPMR